MGWVLLKHGAKMGSMTGWQAGLQEGCLSRRQANQRTKGRMTATPATSIALPMPGQLLAREAAKCWATAPAQAPVGEPAKTAGLSARSRTALQRPPRWQQNHASQRHGQGGLEFGVKKP